MQSLFTLLQLPIMPITVGKAGKSWGGFFWPRMSVWVIPRRKCINILFSLFWEDQGNGGPAALEQARNSLRLWNYGDDFWIQIVVQKIGDLKEIFCQVLEVVVLGYVKLSFLF